MVPLYEYPGQDYVTLLELHEANPCVPLVAIVSPNRCSMNMQYSIYQLV